MSNWIDNVTSNVAKAVMGAVALVVTTAMVTSFNKPTKEYVDFKDDEIKKEIINLRAVHNAEFKSLERTIKLEMDAMRKSIEDWCQSDKDKYEIILKLIDKQNSKN